MSLEKAGFLAAKFDARFHVGRTKEAACRARKHGESSSRLLMLYTEKADSNNIFWILLHQPSERPDLTEKWQDALSVRIVITRYELVRLTKPQEPNPVWTWRYCRTRHDEIRNALISAVRSHRDDEVRQIIHSVWRSPGFGGIREQVKKFKALIEGEWKRSRQKGIAPPDMPTRIGYVRRLRDVGVRLSQLRQMQAAKRSEHSGRENDLVRQSTRTPADGLAPSRT